MRNGVILTNEEITDIIDDITRLFLNDVLTGSIILTITYKSLMTLKGHYIRALKGNRSMGHKESIDERADFVEEICDQIRFTDLDGEQNSSLS